MERKKTRKQTMRDLKRSIVSRISQTDKASDRLLYGDISTVKRKKSKVASRVQAEAADLGLKDRDSGASPGAHDREEA